MGSVMKGWGGRKGKGREGGRRGGRQGRWREGGEESEWGYMYKD